jgi:hypothetical protein
MNYDELMSNARRTNAKRDKQDRKNNFAAPGDLPLVEHIRTAMMAIEAGIKTDDWENIAEGQAMLEDAVKRLQG